MSVQRASDSKTISRDGFCRLLVKIVTDVNDASKNEYSEELARYLKGLSIDKIGSFYNLKVSVAKLNANENAMDIEIPEEFRTKDMTNNHTVRLLLATPKTDLKFNIRETGKK